MAFRIGCRRIAALPETPRWLSSEEHARLSVMRSPARRAQFLAGRLLLRELLVDAEGGLPADWALGAAHDGPPRVLGRPGPCLALSHSGDWVAAGVGPRALGVDLECPRRPRDVEGLAALCCGADEQALLARAGNAHLREALFYELWTVKEAWLKRHAEGVAPARMRQVHARPHDDELSADVRVWPAGDGVLAVSVPAGAVLQWVGLAAPPLRSAWRVVDDLRTVSAA